MRPMNSKARKIEHLVAKFANERRASRGLDRLDSDRALTAAAREHSRDMARREFLGHSGLGGKPSERVEKYDSVAENCHMVRGWNRSPGSIAADALEGWMESRGHRNNILHSRYTRTGVGSWKNGNDVYITQMFLPKWANVESSHLGRGPEDPIGDFLDDVKRRLPVG